MNVILSIPLEIRLAVVFVLGRAGGGRQLGDLPPGLASAADQPLVPARSVRPAAAAVGSAADRRLARACDGRPPCTAAGFWVRPMLVEVLMAWALPGCIGGRSSPTGLLPRASRALLGPGVQTVLHLEFAAHCLLIALMLAGSLIDVDEKIIPDEITVPGTLVGLLLAAAWPLSLLPDRDAAAVRLSCG